MPAKSSNRRPPVDIYEGALEHLNHGMLLLVAYFLVAGIGFCAWYWIAIRKTRQRAVEVVQWLQSALSGQGQVTGIRWISSSRFRVPLRLKHGLFHRACIVVEFIPREVPLNWLLSRLNGRQETMTFQADLDLPPAFSLHVRNFRWFARSSRRTPSNRAGWRFEQAAPVVISTRSDWQKELSTTVTAMAHRDSQEFLSIDFQRRSPHFSVTLPLEAIAPDSPTSTCLFDSMRELASNSSASLF